MTAITPPGARRSRNATSPRASPPISSFTAMRTAWKSRANSGAPAAAAEHRPDGPDEIVAGGERLPLTSMHHLAGEPPRLRLVPVLFEDARARPPRCRSGRRPRRTRRADPCACRAGRRREGEAARVLVELARRDAEVEEDAVEGAIGEREDGVDVVVISPRRPRTPRCVRRRRGVRGLPRGRWHRGRCRRPGAPRSSSAAVCPPPPRVPSRRCAPSSPVPPSVRRAARASQHSRTRTGACQPVA